MSELRILMLNYEFPPIGGGGAQAHLSLLEQFRDDPGLQVDVLTSGRESGVTRESFGPRITVMRVGIHKPHLHHWRKTEVLEWLVKANRHYRRLISQHPYDLVHAFFGFPSGLLCWRSAHRLPYLISLRGSDVPGQNARLQRDYRILGPLFKTIWRKAAGLVACSQGLVDRAQLFLPDVSISVIPNGVSLARFHAKTKTPNTPARLISVGRLTQTKRLDLLIDVVAHVRHQGLDVSLRLVGEGPLYDTIKAQIETLDLVPYVTLTGRLESDAMPALYEGSDLYISATMQEGMSNAMLEAMASGLPIVTTTCEGAEELIEDNGIVVDTPSVSTLAESITRVLTNPDTYADMSRAARARALQFSWEGIADQYVRLYHVIAGQRSPHS